MVELVTSSVQKSANVAEVIVQMDESVEKIVKASDMIRAILDQINLLSLNAAIKITVSI